MSRQTFFLPEALQKYMLDTCSRELPIQRALREETATLPRAAIQSSPEQVQFLQLLVSLIGASECLEIGVFTGYSVLGVALALPGHGRIVACEINETVTRVGRRYWDAAGVSSKIDLRIGPAVETLDGLIAQGRSETFDFAYIDADKTNSRAYYEKTLTLLRPNGVICIDNVFWGGRVAAEQAQDPDTNFLRSMNALIGLDPRVDISMLPIGDGLSVVRKRSRAVESVVPAAV